MQTEEPTLDVANLLAGAFVRTVEVHDELGSTNDRAAELARELPSGALPALVVARRQTAGRGRGSNAWWSADGALTFSLLIDESSTGVRPADWPQLSLATAVAVCDVLEAMDWGLEAQFDGLSQSPAPSPQHPAIGIKWPNDVFLDGRKVCGILIESPSGAAPAKDRLVVGVGINVNNSWRDAPTEAARNGTALCDATGQIHDVAALLQEVVRAIAGRIGQVRTQAGELPEAWRRLNLLQDKRVVVELDGRQVEGTCVEIANDGGIVVDTVSGRQQLFSGSIRRWD